MDIVNLLSEAHQAEIHFFVQDGILKYKAPTGAFTAKWKEIAASNKQNIIAFLERQKWNDILKTKIEKASRNDLLPLSYGQKWLWLAAQMDSRSYAFHIPAAFRLKGKLHLDALKESIRCIIQRHEILRTVYRETEGEVYQVILPEITIDIPTYDLIDTEEEAREAEVLAEMEKQMHIPFNLSEGPLIRAEAVQLTAEECVFIFIFHHIICDNQSMNLFLSELICFYTQYEKKSKKLDVKEEVLPDLPVQYADYAFWQRNRLEGGLKEKQVSYWKEVLQGLQEIPEIHGDYTRLDSISVRSIREHYTIPENIADRLKEISQNAGCSFYVTVLSVFKILLYQYSGISDIVVGSPVAGREREELQPLIGLFFNTVVIRSKIMDTSRFTEFMDSVKQSASGAFANQDIPFELLCQELNVPKQTNKTPVFQVLFNLYSTRYKGELPGASIEVFHKDLIGGQNINSKFDITLLAIEHEEGIQLDFSFKADIFSESTVQWLVEQFKKLTMAITVNPEILVNRLPELKPIPTPKVYCEHPFLPFAKEDTNQSIISRFEQQAALYPNKTALEMQSRSMNYLELKKASEHLGAVIRNSVAAMPRLSEKERTRYARQIILDGWGIESQEKLKGLTVFAAGAGGSGSPVIMQLALLGVGTIIICDFDTVELSNLNRQALHDESRIGMNKAESAAMTVRRMNPHVKTIVIEDKIEEDNIFELVGKAAVIFDNVDNIEAKFAISKCAVEKRIPHVLSSMIERSAYAVIFHTPYTPCFHCCYDYEKMSTVRQFRKKSNGFEKVANSVSSPALFLSAGFAVNEVLKIVLGFENPAYNKYFLFNSQASENFAKTRGYQIVTYPFSKHFRETCIKQGFDWEKGFSGRILEEINIEKDPDCILCGALEEEKAEKAPENTFDCEDPDIVALLMNHSINMVAGIMGVLKSGYAFVPLDPEYPKERLTYILKDTNAHCILCDEENEVLAGEIAGKVNRGIKVINIEKSLLNETPKELKEDFTKPDGLAYILYTSGSMGQPKGVMQTHRNILHYTMNYTNGLHIGSDDRLSLIPSFIFSAAMMDVFAALTNGAALCLYDFKKKGPKKLGSWISNHKISVYHSVPTVFRHFTAAIENGTTFPNLRVIDFGGEALTKKDVELYHTCFSDSCVLINGLGATELNVIRQFPINRETMITNSTVPVGYSVEDTQIQLIDESGRKLAYNQPGEIIIKSRYLSPGYWGLEEQTKTAFRQEDEDTSIRSFHTGDLGRIRPDGCLEHLGRIDLQIKIRGIRLEPAEIENRIMEIVGIKEAAVIVKEGESGSKHLTAYFAASVDMDLKKVRNKLKEKLPSYMIPSYFMQIDKMPLTATGKIDRRALPNLLGRVETSVIKEDPENEIQSLLVSIWKSVLEVKELGISDNFIDLGGDSIKAIKVNAELVQMGLTVKVQDIIETHNIKELSEKVKPTEHAADERIKPHAPLTPTQIDYFDYNHHDEINIWNISTILYKKDGFQENFLKESIQRVMEHHDALRIVFKFENGHRMQYCRDIQAEGIYGYYYFDMTMYDNVKEHITLEANKIQRMNNLSDGPLLQIAFFKTNDCDYLLISIHHMVCDFISANILIKDFCSTYSQIENGNNLVFPVKTDSFMKWSLSMYKAAFSKELFSHLDYWIRISEMPVDILPTDHDCVQRLVKDRGEITNRIAADKTAKVLESLQSKYQVTAEVIILTTLGRAVKRWCQIPLIRVDFAINGRTGDYEELDVSRTVGWFAAAIPIIVDSTSEDLPESLKKMEETRNSVPGNASDYYILRNITLPEKYPEMTLHSPKEIYLNFLGQRSSTNYAEQMNENFGVSNIPVGSCISKEADLGHKLAVTLSVTDGELCFTLQFANTEYEAETMENLIAFYFEEFLSLEKGL